MEVVTMGDWIPIGELAGVALMAFALGVLFATVLQAASREVPTPGAERLARIGEARAKAAESALAASGAGCFYCGCEQRDIHPDCNGGALGECLECGAARAREVTV